MRSILQLLLLSTMATALQTGCRTASDATATGLGAGSHAVDKTGRVLAHRARKVENNL